MDEEVAEGLIQCHRLRFDTAHRRCRGPSPQPIDQPVDCLRSPLGEDLDPPIGEVPHPADETQATGYLSTTLPITHLLHAT